MLCIIWLQRFIRLSDSRNRYLVVRVLVSAPIQRGHPLGCFAIDTKPDHSDRVLFC